MSQQINLYNPIFLKQEKHFSARTMAQALGVIALALVALSGYALLQGRQAAQTAQQQRQQLAAQRDQMLKLATQLGSQGVSKTLEAQVARAEAEVKARQSTLDALQTGELGNTSGFSDFLAAFGRQALAGVWLTGFTIADAGNELMVNGRALEADLVPGYLRALNHEAIMRGRRVVDLRLAAKSGPPPAADKGRGEPSRYVEFSFVAPLQVRPAAAKGANP